VAKSRNDILFRFLGDTKSLDKASAKAKGGFKQTQRAASSLTSMVGGLAVAFGVRGLAGKIGDAVGRAEAMDSQYAITEQVIAQTGGAAGVTAEQIKTMNAEMAMTTGIDKEVLTKSSNIMLTFAEVKDVAGEMNDVFSRSVALTADMATVFGGSAYDAAKQLGKALNDPIKGVTALSRMGVQFTDQQRTQIKVLQESGKTLEAQKLILAELDSQVGGTAEASADATAIMARSFDEVTEAIGKELLPTVQELTPVISKMAKASIPVVGELAKKFADLGSDAGDVAKDIGWLADAVGDYVKVDTGAIEETSFLGTALGHVGDAAGFAGGTIIDLTWGLGKYIAVGAVDTVRELNEELSEQDEDMIRLQRSLADASVTAAQFAKDEGEIGFWAKEAGKYAPDFADQIDAIGVAAGTGAKNLQELADQIGAAKIAMQKALPMYSDFAAGMASIQAGGSLAGAAVSDPVAESQQFNDIIAIGNQTGG